MTPVQAERWFKMLMQVTGAVMLTALGAVVMPRSMIDYFHRTMGLGDFPAGPMPEYLARLTSALYAMLGGLFLVLARDPRRYAAPMVFAILSLPAISVLVSLCTLSIGLPWWWMTLDIVTVALFAAAAMFLRGRMGPAPTVTQA